MYFESVNDIQKFIPFELVVWGRDFFCFHSFICVLSGPTGICGGSCCKVPHCLFNYWGAVYIPFGKLLVMSISFKMKSNIISEQALIWDLVLASAATSTHHLLFTHQAQKVFGVRRCVGNNPSPTSTHIIHSKSYVQNHFAWKRSLKARKSN